MALVQFIETTSTKLDSLPIVEGRFTFTTDTKKLYRDTADEHTAISPDNGLVDVSIDANNERLVFTFS